MKASKLFVVALAVLMPAAMASAYTLSVSSPAQLPNVPAAASSTTITISLSGAQAEQILSAQALLQVQGGPAGLTLTGGTGLGAGMIFTAYSDSESGNLATQSANSPLTNARYRALFVPTNGDGIPVPQTLTDGVLMTAVLNIPAGLPKGDYPIVLLGLNGTDTFVSLADGSQLLASAATNGLLKVVPEPASALLLLGALPFLRRRSA